MNFDDAISQCKAIRKWTHEQSTSQDIEKLTTGRMRIVSVKATIGEMLAMACVGSAGAEKNRRYIEDTAKYREMMATDVVSKAEVIARNECALQRGEEIMAEGEQKAIRVLWSDLGDILDTLNQRIAVLRSEFNDKNKAQ